MKPLCHPKPVNDPWDDPCVYVEFLFERRAILFDLGDIHALPARKILRLSDVFISHAHMDHFVGFDRLLRVCLGRDKTVRLYGPSELTDRVEHKLSAYTWNLLSRYPRELVVIACEFAGDARVQCARFGSRTAFRRQDWPFAPLTHDTLLKEDGFRVRAAVLNHRIPCLGFTLEEMHHVNVWKNRLVEMGLPTGAWLRELKAAVLAGAPDERPFRAWWRSRGQLHERYLPLGELKRRALQLVPGQKISYVVDVLYDASNVHRIEALIQGSDYLFIEAAFLHNELGRARDTYHLTARQAGLLGRRAGVKRLVPIHFSTRHQSDPEPLRREVLRAFGEEGTGSATEARRRTPVTPRHAHGPRPHG
jgi:ribonuclease Z